MRVLIACESSGVVRRAFAALGHDAVSCDLLPAEDGAASQHVTGDVLPPATTTPTVTVLVQTLETNK